MKVIISAGGRFHAIRLAQQFAKCNSFLKLFSFSYMASDEQTLNQSYVKIIQSCKILDDIFLRLRLSCLINVSTFNYIKDNLFDYLVNRQLQQQSSVDLFIGWAHYSLRSMQTVRRKGALIVIESGSSHIQEQQRLLEEEYKKWGVNFTPIHPKVIDKMTREYALADYIMTLSTASRHSFVRYGIPEHKVLQAPCGVDVEYFLPRHENHSKKILNEKFRVIFVGLINIRKGIPYLLDAWNKLNLPEESTELVLVGSLQKDMAQLLPKLSIKKNIIFYGSTNRETLKKLYYQSSVFVLPSVEDGFGMVMGEAMASGLPVICTTNTGAPDVIKDKIHGFLIPPQNSLVLAEKIAWCYEHRDACITMGKNGQNRIQDFTWDTYGEKVYNIYEKILKEKK